MGTLTQQTKAAFEDCHGRLRRLPAAKLEGDMADMTHFDATGRPTAELQSWLAHCRAFGLPAVVVAHPPGRMRIAVDGVEVEE